MYKAKTVAAFARMTVKDSKAILPAEFYPAWVVFTERQKLSFLLAILILFSFHLCMSFRKCLSLIFTHYSSIYCYLLLLLISSSIWDNWLLANININVEFITAVKLAESPS